MHISNKISGAKIHLLVNVLLVLALLSSILTSCAIIVKKDTEAPPAPAATTTGAISQPTAPPEPGFSPRPLANIPSSLPSITEVVDKVKPSVVSILTETLAFDIFLQPVPSEGAGSGFIIDSRGYIATNNHVVERSTNILVVLPDGRQMPARIVGRDPLTDLAVVKIEAENLPALVFADTSKLKVGDWVIALGNALGLPGGPTVTQGIVSYMGRSIQEPNGATLNNLVQTDAAINPGNSGGPLVNLAGQVIGINTAIAGGAQNIGFAISPNDAQSIITTLITTGKIVRAWLGVGLISVTRNIQSRFNLGASRGALISTMAADSPADKAGLKQGDVIIDFNGTRIDDSDSLVRAIQAKNPGDRVEITYIRDGKEVKTFANLIERPTP